MIKGREGDNPVQFYAIIFKKLKWLILNSMTDSRRYRKPKQTNYHRRVVKELTSVTTHRYHQAHRASEWDSNFNAF